MSTTTPLDATTQETPLYWLATSTIYPRITVTANTEEEAINRLVERRQWWLDLPPAVPSE